MSQIVPKKRRSYERRRRYLPEAEWLRVEQEYLNGQSLNTICEAFDVGYSAVKKYLGYRKLLRSNVAPRPSRNKRLELVKRGKYADMDFFKR